MLKSLRRAYRKECEGYKKQGKKVYKAEFGRPFGSESLRNNRNGVRKPLESFFIKSSAVSSLSSFFYLFNTLQNTLNLFSELCSLLQTRLGIFKRWKYLRTMKVLQLNLFCNLPCNFYFAS